MDSVNKSLSVFAILMCLILAYYVKFENLTAGRMSESRKNVLLVILLLYAAFRSYRLYQMFNKSKLKEDEE